MVEVEAKEKKKNKERIQSINSATSDVMKNTYIKQFLNDKKHDGQRWCQLVVFVFNISNNCRYSFASDRLLSRIRRKITEYYNNI